MSIKWSLVPPPHPGPVVQNIIALLQRQVIARSGQSLPTSGNAERHLVLEMAPGIGEEGFSLRDDADGALHLVGNDERGLLYGVGKLLRDATYAPGVFTPGPWRGISVPHSPVRGIYFATHFHNWYHDSPVDEVERYVEELALWGYNSVCVWFDMHHYQSITDPAAQAMLERLLAILRAARRVGLSTAAGFLANEAYADSPQHLRADWTAGHDGYHHEPGGHYHVELCPSKPGATELVLRWAEEKLAAFAPVGLDYLWIWPYDQGGCTCRECAPWGTNGFLRLAEPTASLFRRYYPQGKVVLSTWYFDHFIDGEWEGLARAFSQKPVWVDYLLADDNADQYPAYPLEHGVPGGLPLLGFPEISMYRCNPWGGYGANPFPAHLQHLWDQAKQQLSGGFPYSEGKYEDINKAICAQFFWDANKAADETVREYIAYEFSPRVVDGVSAAVAILEKNLPRTIEKVGDGHHFPLQHTDRVEECWQLVQQADTTLPPDRRVAWRWRVLYLRALIDRELVVNNGWSSTRCEAAFNELTDLYHAREACLWIAPPTREALASGRSVD